MCEVGQQEVMIELRNMYRLSLAVTGAVQNGQGVWVASYGGPNLVITATTNDAPVNWDCAPLGLSTVQTATTLTFNTNAANNVLSYGEFITVTASTPNSDPVAPIRVCILPTLAALDLLPDHYAFDEGGDSWYALCLRSVYGAAATNYNCALEVTTNPSTPAAWSHVAWSAERERLIMSTAINLYTVDVDGNQSGINVRQNLRGVRLHERRKVFVKVKLRSDPDDTHAITRTVDIRNPATTATVGNNLRLALREFTFAGAGRFGVTREDSGDFNGRYSARWRPDQDDPPQAYTAGGNVALDAVTLGVTGVPTADTRATVRASAYFPTHNGALVVRHQTSAQSNAVRATDNVGVTLNLGNLGLATVPNEVMCNNPFLIFWEVSGDNGATWAPLQLSANDVYVTAQAPVTSTRGELNRGLGPVYTYDSFLAISCKAAAGEPCGAHLNVQNVRTRIAQAFALPPDSSNDKMRLLYRGQAHPPSGPMTYWKNGREPAQRLNYTGDIEGGNVFTNRYASVACGVWAEMLQLMWALHGIGDGNRVEVRTNSALNAAAANAVAFTVRNWSYTTPPALNVNDFTYRVTAQARGVGTVPTQNNQTSPRRFGNHFVIWDDTNKDLYDPSYGVQATTMAIWVQNATAGLLSRRMPHHRRAGFVQANLALPNDVESNPQAVTFTDKVTNAVPV